MGTFLSQLAGTLSDLFKIGKNGPYLRNNGGLLEVRNPDNTTYAPIKVGDAVGQDDAINFRMASNLNQGALPGSVALGSLMDYRVGGNLPANDIQYTRVFLVKGQIFNEMGTFITAGGTNLRYLRFGIYDQADPTDLDGTPNDRVAQTNEVDTDGFNGAKLIIDLTDAATSGSGSPITWEVPATGLYWLAIVQTATALKIIATDGTYPAGYMSRYEEMTTGTTLPLIAGTLTQPTSAVILVAARLDI
jgi:hypothetical protein